MRVDRTRDEKTARDRRHGISVLALVLLLACAAPSGAAGATRPEARFSVAERDGVWWFVGPDGAPFFSNGVNVVDEGVDPKHYTRKAPAYSALRFHTSKDAWASATQERFRRWNFNTIGGWSSEAVHRGPIPYTLVLDLGASAGVPWSDVFGDDVAKAFDDRARALIVPVKDDPNLLGYFSDNELGWWDDTIFQNAFKLPRESATRRVLVETLRECYGDDFARLARSFEVGPAKGFDDLGLTTPPTVRPGGDAMRAVDAFMAKVAERYYRLSHDAIRRYDSDGLVLGDRYLSWYVPAVARASAKYVDVVSTNYMADWNDGSLSRYFLDGLHRITGKPVLISEYYIAAIENRSGNRNSSAGFPTVATQRERARTFASNLEEIAGRRYVVGAHWFQYYDEPTHGRPRDGEDYNFGLVDLDDRPYEALTAAAARLDPNVLHRTARSADTDGETDSIGPLPRTPSVRDALRGMRTPAAYVEPVRSTPEDAPRADLYGWWTPAALHLAIHATDFVDSSLYAGGVIPEQERMSWTVWIDGRETPIRVRLGAGRPARVDGISAFHREWVASTRSTFFISIPSKTFGHRALRAGDAVSIRAEFATHSRAETSEWNAKLRLDT